MISFLDNRAAPGPSHRDGEDVQGHFRILLRRLFYSCGAAPGPRVLGLTSCASGEGVSTVAAQLSITAASCGQPVLLADANLERPALHRLLGVDAGPGFADALGDHERLRELTQPSGVPNLSVLAAGGSAGQKAPAPDPSVLADLIDASKRHFALVVFDLPATTRGAFTARLAGLLDGLLLVVQAERIRYEVLHRETDLLLQGGVRLLGAVLNKRREYVPRWLSCFL